MSLILFSKVIPFQHVMLARFGSVNWTYDSAVQAPPLAPTDLMEKRKWAKKREISFSNSYPHNDLLSKIKERGLPNYETVYIDFTCGGDWYLHT